MDGGAVRAALGLPTRVDIWRERIYGFLFGILAAIIGAIIWDLALKPAWDRQHAPAVQQEPVSAQPTGK